MKMIFILTAILFLSACSTNPPVTTAPWECFSTTEPVDALVVRKEGPYYVFSCLWNGGDEGAGEGEGAE